MTFQPYDTLRNRTFIGLLVAQFLAAFNDQAIHASAMFFALHKGTLTEAQAINLMPILFYSPWAIFCTLAAYFADRYSKQLALRWWKFAEVGITAIAMLGFYLGSVYKLWYGPWIVLGCVFLMGLHSAFFVPAKYGVMPEILTPQMLSRGNGLLESLSFIAIILGTVCGGVLSYYFQRQQTLIGVVLFVLAVVGALASLMIEKMPAANPHRPVPPALYGPLAQSLRTLLASRPLRLTVIGIAVFTFVVAYMRATVYLLGESQNPRWDEFRTSVIVGMSALGVGLGAPLAGFLSGRKIELGLVPLGTIGMIFGAVAASVILSTLTGTAMIAGLVACIILVGFCTGFYLVPMYTLLQHRAPKTSKGDAIATTNFVNVTGAILASGVSAAVVFLATQTGLTPVVTDHRDVAKGALSRSEYDKNGRLVYVEVADADRVRRFGDPPAHADVEEDDDPWAEVPSARAIVIKVQSGVEEKNPDKPVAVSHYAIRGVSYYLIRPADKPLPVAYDTEPLPRYLFLGAALVMLLTLLVLIRQMPDLPARAGWVVRTLRQVAFAKSHLRVFGTVHVPMDGPVVLATNCRDEASCRNVVAATERAVHFVRSKLSEDGLEEAAKKVRAGWVLALSAEAGEAALPGIEARVPATIVPVYYGPGRAEGDSHLRVAFGPPLPAGATPAEVERAIQHAAAMPEDLH